jgi:hypothetical protein
MKHMIKMILILFVPAFLLSCSEGLNTLFDNIVNDNLIDDNELDNTISVTGMVKLGTRYYITAGKIRTRDEASTNWSSFSVATGIHNYITTDNTNLYITVLRDNNTSGLYRYLPGGPATIDEVNFAPAAMNVGKVKNCGGQIYISVRKLDNTYSLYQVSGLSANEVAATNSAAPILDFTSNGGLCYTTGHNVFVGGTDVAPNPAYIFNCIYNFDGRIYLGSNNGALYQSTNGSPSSATDWLARTGFKFNKNGNDEFVHFSTFEGITGTTNRLFVGTRGNGFYEIEPVAFTVARFGDASKAELYTGAVETFYIDPANPVAPEVFCGTMGAGLWHNNYTLDTAVWGATWTRE